MSEIRLKCDICGGFFRDTYVHIKCGYCEKKEKKELIEEFIKKLEALKTDNFYDDVNNVNRVVVDYYWIRGLINELKRQGDGS